MIDIGYEPGPATRKEIADSIAGASPPRGHKYWGLTIFRCTYSNDAAWSRIMEFIESHVHETLESYDADDLKRSLRMTVHSEASILNGASKELVRERFKAWITSEDVRQELVSLDGQQTSISEVDKTPRYEYCLHVDQGALDSIIDPEKQLAKEDAGIRGYVNLIDANWEMPDAGERAAQLRIDDPEEDDPLDDGEEPIDGCKLYDVGWMKVSVIGLMPGGYAKLRMRLWEENYVRPPALAEF